MLNNLNLKWTPIFMGLTLKATNGQNIRHYTSVTMYHMFLPQLT